MVNKKHTSLGSVADGFWMRWSWEMYFYNDNGGRNVEASDKYIFFYWQVPVADNEGIITATGTFNPGLCSCTPLILIRCLTSKDSG